MDIRSILEGELLPVFPSSLPIGSSQSIAYAEVHAVSLVTHGCKPCSRESTVRSTGQLIDEKDKPLDQGSQPRNAGGQHRSRIAMVSTVARDTNEGYCCHLPALCKDWMKLLQRSTIEIRCNSVDEASLQLSGSILCSANG